MKNFFAILFILLGALFISNVNITRADKGSDDSSQNESSDDDSSAEDESSSDDEEDTEESDDSGMDSASDMDESDEDESDDSGMDSASDLDDSDEDESSDDSFNRPVKKIRSEAPFFLKRISEERPTLLDNRVEVREKLEDGDISINKGKGSISDARKIFEMSGEEAVRARGLVAMRFTTAMGNLERMSVRIDSAITKLSDKGYDMSEAKSLYENSMDKIDEARVQVEEFVAIIKASDTTAEEARSSGTEAKTSLQVARDALKSTVDEIKSKTPSDDSDDSEPASATVAS